MFLITIEFHVHFSSVDHWLLCTCLLHYYVFNSFQLTLDTWLNLTKQENYESAFLAEIWKEPQRVMNRLMSWELLFWKFRILRVSWTIFLSRLFNTLFHTWILKIHRQKKILYILNELDLCLSWAVDPLFDSLEKQVRFHFWVHYFLRALRLKWV